MNTINLCDAEKIINKFDPRKACDIGTFYEVESLIEKRNTAVIVTGLYLLLDRINILKLEIEFFSNKKSCMHVDKEYCKEKAREAKEELELLVQKVNDRSNDIYLEL